MRRFGAGAASLTFALSGCSSGSSGVTLSNDVLSASLTRRDPAASYLGVPQKDGSATVYEVTLGADSVNGLGALPGGGPLYPVATGWVAGEARTGALRKASGRYATRLAAIPERKADHAG